MESKTGSLLAKISGIMSIVLAGIVLLVGIIVLIVGLASAPVEGTTQQPLWIGIIIMLASIIVLIVGLFFLKASGMMKIPEKTKGGAILSLVLGILTAGNVIGILGIIGGAIGLSDSKKQAQTK